MAKRYELKEGRFGMYFLDTDGNYSMGLGIVLEKLNRIEEYKARLANVNKIHPKPLGKEW